MLALVERAYDVIEKSWLDVAEVGRQFAEGKVKARHVLQKMEALQSEYIVNVLQTCDHQYYSSFFFVYFYVLYNSYFFLQMITIELPELRSTRLQVN